ncbi:MAG TPA: DUF882 domain-containing protein [Polyangiaceae bacterium]|nr:DUF882 domain-containing protein [Polyangiaceae bacterium]
MRPTQAARVLACAVAVGSAASAIAEPPHRAKRMPSPPAPSTRPGTPAAASYMSGKQALVGLHAASEKAVVRDATGRPMLSLMTVNRRESLDIAALSDEGGFSSIDLDRAAHLLRAASGDEHPVDPRTLAMVYRVEAHFGVPEVRVISGYRNPKPGSRSNHGKGRAMDLIVPGVADEDVARFAREMGFVGVGVYPTSQFVHLDVRPRSYFWVDYSGPHMRNRESGILGDLARKSDAEALARGQSPVEPFAIARDVEGALRARGLVAPPSAVPEEDEDDEN